MIGLGTRTSYFRSSYKSIKCFYCDSTFSANKERVRHINWKHPDDENETTEDFNKGLRLINVNQLSDTTRKDLKSIILPYESLVPHNTKVVKKKAVTKKFSPNSLPGVRCSVSSSVPDVGSLASSTADVSGQEVMSSPLQRTRELDDSLIPFRRQMEIVYNESFIPDDLNSCQVLLREILVNHFDISQYALTLQHLLDGMSYSQDDFDDILGDIL